jgi:hypothetical protein
MGWVGAGLGLLLAGTACQSRPDPSYNPVVARFFIEAGSEEATAGVNLPQSNLSIPVRAKAVLVETDIINVELVRVELGLCLLFQVTPAAARDLFRLTASNQGRRLVLTLNGSPSGARLIDRPFGDGNIMIFVEMPEADLPGLVHNLKASAQQWQRELARRRRT